MGLNSGGEGLRLTDFKLSLRGMQGVTERNSLNWLFGVSCMVFSSYPASGGVQTVFLGS